MTVCQKHQPWVPLAVGVVVSVALHVAAVPVVVRSTIGRRAPDRMAQPRRVDEPDPQKVGQDNAAASSVAWISHRDFQDLLARQGRVDQPALQQKVEPVEDADTPADPTPAAPAALHPVITAVAEPPSPQQPIEAVRSGAAAPVAVPLKAAADWVLAAVVPNLAITTGAVSPDPSPVAPQHQPPAPRPDTHREPQPAVETLTEPKPTSAAKSDAQSPPVRLTEDAIKVRPGKVIVGEGIEIRPARPRFSVVTLVSAIPNNPRARLNFDRDGKVVAVELLTSTGYTDLDGPIEASLYKWRARGPRLEKLTTGFEIEVELILID